MLNFAFAAILATSLGQAPPADYPIDNTLGGSQAFGQNATGGFAGYDAGMGGYGGFDNYGYSYPANPAIFQSPNSTQASGKNSVGSFGVSITGYAPKCPQGAYIGCGTFIGPYPARMQCQATPTQYGMQQCPGGYCPVPQISSFPVQTGIGGQRFEEEKEHKEITLRLEQLKLQLSKMTDALREMEKRLETTEKASVSTESKVKGFQEEVKQRWFLQDIEQRFDNRIKPIEESIKQLNRKMEYYHRPGSAGAEAKKSNIKGDEALLISIDEKIDRLQVLIFDQLKQLNDQLKEERGSRIKLEERVKSLEKGGGVPLPPFKEDMKKEEIKKEEIKKEEIKKEDLKKEDLKKEDLKKEDLKKDDLKKEDLKKDDKEKDTSNLSKLKVARVSHVHGGAPADRALLIVHLPADARLYLNGNLTRSQGTQRTFLTPELEPGSTFEYAIRIELPHEGKLLTQTRTVNFRAGGQAVVVFEGPGFNLQTARR